MAIAFGAAGTKLHVSTATTAYNVPYPSGITAGQFLILFISLNGGSGANSPSDWIEVYNDLTLSNPKGGIWYKIADGTESGTLAVTLGSAVNGSAMILRYTGVDTTTPFDTFASTIRNTTAGTSTVLPTITTVTANAMLIYANAINSSTQLLSSTTGTERVDFNQIQTGGKGGALYEELKATAGATGTRTIAIPQSLANWGVMMALRPAVTSSAFTGSAALSGSGTLTSTRIVGTSTSRALTGSGTLTTSATLSVTTTCSLSGSGTLSAIGSAVVGSNYIGSAPLSGSGTLSTSVNIATSTAVGQTGSGTLSALGKPVIVNPSTVTFSGSGLLNASGKLGGVVTVSLSGSGALTTSTKLSASGTAALSGTGSLSTYVSYNIPFVDTNIYPKPYVRINGTEMPISFSQGDAVVLEGLNIHYGRDSLLGDVNPAQLSLSILDRDGTWVAAQPFLGMEIIIGNRGTDNENIAFDFISFRGRIIETEAVARDTYLENTTAHGYIIYIQAVDKLAELGNRFVSNTSWPSEDASARRSRLESAAGGAIAGVGGVYTNQVTYCAKSIDQSSVLELIEDFFKSTGETINYDPHTNRVEAEGRFELVGQGLRLSEIDNEPGTYGLELDSASGLPYADRRKYELNAKSLTARSGIRRTVESTITEIKYEYPTDASGSTRATFVDTANMPDQNIYGKRSLTVRGDIVNIPASMATTYNILARAAQGWRPPEVEWDTRRKGLGFQYYPQMISMIGGRAFTIPLFLSRSLYNSFPALNATTGNLRTRVPVYWVIGGSMTYEADASGDMGWVVSPNFANVIYYSDFTPLTWSTINPSSSPVVTWESLNANVTWNDINLTGQGV